MASGGADNMMEKWAFFGLGAMFSIAAAQILIKVAIKDIDYGTAMVVLHVAALGGAFAVFGVSKFGGLQTAYTLSSISLIAAAGILIGIVNLFIFLAFLGGPVSRITPILGLAPAILVLAGYFMFNETITIKTGAGIILALTAIILLST
ncbi:MAG: EamA family transporter [Candidatus Undinarchaeales archaeon]